MRRTLPAPQQKMSQSPVSIGLRLRNPGPGTGRVCPAMALQVSLVLSLLFPGVPTQTLSILFKLVSQLPPPSDSTLSLPAFNYTELSSLPDALSSSPKSPRTPALISTLPLSQLLLVSSRRLVGQPLTRSGPSSPFPTAAHPNRTRTTLILCV